MQIVFQKATHNRKNCCFYWKANIYDFQDSFYPDNVYDGLSQQLVKVLEIISENSIGCNIQFCTSFGQQYN